MNSSWEYYFNKYLKKAPLSLAVWRAGEAVALGRYKMEPPVLDLGCGFGEFASAYFRSPVDIGLDISLPDLKMAESGRIYKKTVLADARQMPLKSGSVNTVISISVLEHIQNVDLVLAECYRVLKPKGKLIVTLPTKKLNRYLGNGSWPDIIFRRFMHRAFLHYNIFDLKKWQMMLAKQGFVIKDIKPTITREDIRVFREHLVASLPSYVGRKLTGRRLIDRSDRTAAIFAGKYKALFANRKTIGANVIIMAEKP